MQLNPVYGDTPILHIEGLGDPTVAVRRQCERLTTTLRALDESQWGTQSRCEKWSVKDVVAHLSGTNQFWAISFGAGMRGEPTTFLGTFDPVATPEQMVDGTREVSAAEVLERFEANAASMLDTIAAVADWSVLAEAPPGHLALNAAALHALWDSWTHERDIVIPLGLAPAEEPDEVTLILQYAAALAPAFYAARRTGRRGTLTIEATEPDVTITVDVGDRVVVRPGAADGPRLTGRAVDLIEGLSHRAPLPNELAPEDRWLLVGLADVFDVA